MTNQNHQNEASTHFNLDEESLLPFDSSSGTPEEDVVDEEKEEELKIVGEEGDTTNATLTTTHGNNGASAPVKASPDSENHRSEVPSKQDAITFELKRNLECGLDEMRLVAKRLMKETATYVKNAESVTNDYHHVLEAQQKEAQRLELVSRDVENATNPILHSLGALTASGFIQEERSD